MFGRSPGAVFCLLLALHREPAAVEQRAVVPVGKPASWERVVRGVYKNRGQARIALGASQQAPSEKESRTPAQRKINSQLLYELYRLRGQATEKKVPSGQTGVRIDRNGRALVDVRAEVTSALQKTIRMLGGTIESTSGEYRSVIAWIPLRRLERLAEDPAVRAIEPAAEAAIRKERRKVL